MSNSSISRIYLPAITNNGSADLELEGPLVGPNRQWASTDDFTVEIMAMIMRGEDVVDGYSGSDQTIMLEGDDTRSFNSAVSAVMRVYGAANDAQRQDGAYLRAQFRNQFGMDFVGRNDDAVFRVEYRYVNPAAGRNTGVREGGLSGSADPRPTPRARPRRSNLFLQGASRGHVAELCAKFGDPENIGAALNVLQKNPEWCWSYRDKYNRVARLSAGATLLRLQGMACIPLGYWLRMDKGPLSDFCYTLLGVTPRNQQEVGRQLPRAVANARGELPFMICAILAKEANIPAHVYWESHIGDRVSIDGVNAISHALKINSHVMRMDEFQRYNKQLNVIGKKIGFTRRSEWPQDRPAQTHVTVMIRCKGRVSVTGANSSRNRARNGHDIMIICSHLEEETAHVDFVLDPVYENNMFGKTASNVIHYNMTYGKPGEDTRPYYERLVLNKEASKIVPKHSYANLERLDLVETVRMMSSCELVHIHTDTEYDLSVDSVVEGLVRLSNGGQDREVDTSVFGKTFLYDQDFVQKKAGELDCVENNVCGLVYLMGDIVSRIEQKQKMHLVDCSDFRSTNSPKRIQRLYAYQLRQEPNGTFDVRSNFNDVSRFTLSLATPRLVDIENRTHGRKRQLEDDDDNDNASGTHKQETVDELMAVSLYSKKKFDEAGVYMKTKTIQDALESACEQVKNNLRGEDACARFEKMVTDGAIDRQFQLKLSSTPLFHFVISQKRPALFGRITDLFGDTPAYLERSIRTTDPQIDEPVSCVGVIKGKRNPATDAIEMDANSFYPSLMCGRHNQLLETDFYGLKWLDKIGDHSVRTRLAKDDFLRSYDSDLGSCFIENIDFAVLKTELGLTDLCSWSHFDAARIDKVSRNVLNGSVIHFTQVLYKKIKAQHDAYLQLPPCPRNVFPPDWPKIGKRVPVPGMREPWLFKHHDDRSAIWRFIQHKVLRIRWVFFHNDEDTRLVGHRLQSLRLRHRVRPVTNYTEVRRNNMMVKKMYEDKFLEKPLSPYNEFELGKGILMRHTVMQQSYLLQTNLNHMHQVAMNLACEAEIAKARMEKEAEGGELSTEDEEDARARATKMVKLDENSFIGRLKYLKYNGGLQTIRQTDAIEASEDDNSVKTWTFQGVECKEGYATQVATRELPGTDFVLKENVFVAPMMTSKGPAGLRRNILEIGRLVMDILVDVTDAYSVKTDAVFFDPSKLDVVIDFLNSAYRGTYHDAFCGDQSGVLYNYDWIMEQFEKCKTNGCGAQLPKPTYCKLHFPSISRRSLKYIVPFKFILHPGTGPEQPNGAQMFSRAAVQQRAHEEQYRRLGKADGLTQISRVGERLIQEAIDAYETPPERVLATSCLPSIQDMAQEGIIRLIGSRQVLDSPPEPLSKMELHCKIFETDENADAIVYMPGSAQPYTVNKDAYNDYYVRHMLELMIDWKDGAKLEGKPGMGKSYMIHKLVKEHFYPDVNTLTVVATATQLSIAPYRELTAWEDARRAEEFVGETNVPPPRIEAVTIHSLFNVFKQTKELSRNPPGYLNGVQGPLRGIRKMIDAHTRKLAAGKSSRIQIIIDEFEMCPREFEEPLLYMAEQRGVYIHCVGDRMQTAAISAGMRCDGDVVNTITKNRTLVFDVPFRNTDHEYQMAHEQACNGKPTLFLKAPLADYTHVKSMRDEQVKELTKSTAEFYEACAQKKEVYSRQVIAVQNYKVGGVITTLILDQMQDDFSDVDDSFHPFCGHRAFGGGQSTPRGMYSDTEADSDELGIYGNDEEVVQNPSDLAADARYRSELDHNQENTDPSGAGFYVGTAMIYRPNYSYRATKGFLPKLRQSEVHENLREQAPQRPVRMGEVLMLTRLKTKTVTVINDNNTETQESHVFGEFVTEKNEIFVLQMCEMHAYLYYPFCLTSIGVVGNTYDKYTFIHVSGEGNKNLSYHELVPVVEVIEKCVGDKSYALSLIKTLNVGVSRVTRGNRTRILEVSHGKQGFWKGWMRSTKWHTYGTERFNARSMREMAMQAGRTLKLKESISSIFE